MQILKKILNIVVDILIIILLAISVLVAALALASKANGIPSVLGYAPLSVQSDSMVPEFEQGDLIISRVVEDEYTILEVGDIITFAMDVDGYTVYNTHRIVEVQQADGFTYYITKGDNNDVPDEEPVLSYSVAAVYNTGICLEGWGTIYDFITGQLGFFLVILLPLIIFFLYEVFRVIRNLIAYNKEKAYEAALESAESAKSSGLSDEEMKLAVERYLAQQAEEKAKGEQTDNSNDKDAEE